MIPVFLAVAALTWLTVRRQRTRHYSPTGAEVVLALRHRQSSLDQREVIAGLHAMVQRLTRERAEIKAERDALVEKAARIAWGSLREPGKQFLDFVGTEAGGRYCERDPKCIWPEGHGGDAHCHTVGLELPAYLGVTR